MPLQRKPQFCLYSYIYFEQPLDISRLDSTNDPARAPHSCLIQEVQDQMLHRNKEAGWKYLLQLTEKHRRQSFQVLNHFSRQLLGTKLAEEIAQLCQH